VSGAEIRGCSYRRGTARRSRSVKILSLKHNCTKNLIWKCLQYVNDLEGHSRSSEMALFDRPCHFLLVVCSNNVSISTGISRRFLAIGIRKLQSIGYLRRYRCLWDYRPTLSCSDTTSACDRQTDRPTDAHEPVHIQMLTTSDIVQQITRTHQEMR